MGLSCGFRGRARGRLWAGGDADVHYGLEHFGITVDDMDAELARLQAMGAEVAGGAY